MAAKDTPDARGSKDDARCRQLTLYPAIAPGGILPSQPEDDRHRSRGDARPPRSVGMSPLGPDEIPVPPEQGRGLHEEPTSTSSVHQSNGSGEQGWILWLQGRPEYLATEHSHLVTEHDDLDRQLVAVMAAEAHQLEEFNEGEVEEREGHGPVSSSTAIPGKSSSKPRMTFSAPPQVDSQRTMVSPSRGGQGPFEAKPNALSSTTVDQSTRAGSPRTSIPRQHLRHGLLDLALALDRGSELQDDFLLVRRHTRRRSRSSLVS